MNFSFDLHVLGTPPAFVLSQDQTLDKFVILNPKILYTLLISADFISSAKCSFPNFFDAKNSLVIDCVF